MSFQRSFADLEGLRSDCDLLLDVRALQASRGAFAAICGDGSVVAWGNQQGGGDATAVRGRLRQVRQLAASSCAFAAVLADGSVVTWGHPDSGGRQGVDRSLRPGRKRAEKGDETQWKGSSFASTEAQLPGVTVGFTPFKTRMWVVGSAHLASSDVQFESSLGGTAEKRDGTALF